MDKFDFCRKQIAKRLTEIEADERLKSPPVTVAENAPLALNMEGRRDALRWVLKMMESQGEQA